jgi:hypothetical protein
MRAAKVLTVLSCLFVFSQMTVAQNGVHPASTATKRSTSIPVLYWNETHDAGTWLEQNRSSLNRGDGCQLNVWWRDEGPSAALPSAVHGIVAFVVGPGDEEMTTVFHDSASDSHLDVRVGVRYLPAGQGLPYLNIALALEGSPDDIFTEVSAAEAGALRDKNWKGLRVVKRIMVGNVRYEFSLGCENGKTFMGYLRRPAKHKVATQTRQ